jgi:MFS family permease
MTFLLQVLFQRLLRCNALIGLGVGTAAGLAIGYGIEHCSNKGGWCGLDEAAGTGVGGVAGLVGGTLTGVFWHTGGWRKIYAA